MLIIDMLQSPRRCEHGKLPDDDCYQCEPHVAFELIRSVLRGMPRSRSAEQIDQLCIDALGLRAEWNKEHGQFGVGV